MISALKAITGSLIKSLDIIYVLDGIKPVSRLLIDEDNKTLLDFLDKKGLHYALSDSKIIKHVDQTRAFTDKGIRVSSDDERKGSHLIYISKDKKLTEKAKSLESENNQFELGKILGYPSCCAKFFDKHFDESSRRSMDLVLRTFSESKGFNFLWQNNFCLRGFDISLISHFPCSFNCEKSKQIASKNLEVIKKYDIDVANYFTNALKCAILYSEGIGVFSFKKFKIETDKIYYSSKDVVPSINNDIYNIIKRRDKLRVLGKNHFRIGEVDIEDDQTFFGIFS